MNTNHALSRYHTRLAKSPRRLDPWNTENYHCTLIIETLYISITPDLRPPGGNYVILCNFVFDNKLQHRITFPVIRRLDLYGVICHLFHFLKYDPKLNVLEYLTSNSL